MKSIRLRLFVAIALVSTLPVLGPATMAQDAPRPPAKALTVEDVGAWKSIGATALSKNGEWFAYRLAPQEGDAELVIRHVTTGKETKHALGEVPGGG